MSAPTAPSVPRAHGAACQEDAALLQLLKDAAELLCTRFTRRGHLAQIVVQEGLGNCTVKGCTPAGRLARQWLEGFEQYVIPLLDKRRRSDDGRPRLEAVS